MVESTTLNDSIIAFMVDICLNINNKLPLMKKHRFMIKYY